MSKPENTTLVTCPLSQALFLSLYRAYSKLLRACSYSARPPKAVLTIYRAVGVSLLTMLASCAANKQTVSASPYLSSVVTSALKDVELTYTQKRTPVTFVSGDVADSCQRYFALMENSQVKEGVNNLKAAQNYVICE